MGWDHFRPVPRPGARQVVSFPESGLFTSPKVRRWEVSGFALGAFSDSPKVSRLVLHFSQIGIFGVVPRSIAGCCILSLGHFAAGDPRVRRWVMRFGESPFCIRSSSGQSLGGDFCPKAIFLQSQGQTLGVAFSGIPILQQVIPSSLIRNSLCSTNGYSHLIILTSYLS